MKAKKILTATLVLALSGPALAGPCYTPLVIDSDHNGFKFGSAGDFVEFDMTGNGKKERIQWVRPDGDEVFLAVDLNENGAIDDGGELFGSGTSLILSNSNARDGFAALAQYDDPQLGGNYDGYITVEDSIWSQLVFWLDSNADGISTLGEISSVAESETISFDTIPKSRRARDAAGNWLIYMAWSEREGDGPKKNKVVDVFFKADEGGD